MNMKAAASPAMPYQFLQAAELPLEELVENEAASKKMDEED